MIKKAFLVVLWGLVILGLTGQKSWGLSSYEQSLIQSVEHAFSKEKEIISTDTLRHPVCATPLMMEIMLNWDKISSEAQKILNPYTERPDFSPHTEYTFDSPSGHFKIHYTITGEAAVYRSDIDENQDGIPDYVNQCAVILDHVWSKEIDSLGYDTPPSDAVHPPEMDNGGDGKYDVYLDNLHPDFFGASYPEYQVKPGIPIYTSYLMLRNDYSFWVEEHPLYKNVYEPMKVTAAHEFFHAIHFGYDATEVEVDPDSFYKPYWMEISAVWMEDMVYDNINDYLGYLPHFYQEPWLSLRTFRSPVDYHPYASCVWAFFLQEKFGRDVIKKIWEKCAQVPGDNALQATDE
ncbi:MAG: MXAN_6640 family putative metalloprotease, partial [Candidatus Zixiibacteriota bacterium]